MNYKETLDWMFAQLPMYQRQGKAAFKKDLTNILAFCNELKSPEKRFKSIHVGGTNGKGSTSHMITSILQEAGYKVFIHQARTFHSYCHFYYLDGVDLTKTPYLLYDVDNGVKASGVMDISMVLLGLTA